MDWTDEKLKALTSAARLSLRSNAVKSKAPGAAALVLLIDSLHLPLSSGGMSKDDPIYAELEGLIWSKEFKDAALDAVAKGLPAMAGVDPLLQQAMGPRYHAHNQGTNNAGFIVGEVMRNAGYDKDGEAPLPPGCVAKTAAKWKPKTSLSKA